jgi:hypothetical protein
LTALDSQGLAINMVVYAELRAKRSTNTVNTVTRSPVCCPIFSLAHKL